MSTTRPFPHLTLHDLRRRYQDGASIESVLRELHERITARGEDGVWLHRPSLEELLENLPSDRSLPLFGVPFAVKDNIDVAGWPTTAGCPAFGYTAPDDSFVVARLRAAGAIPIGKTNLDQFATGLVGTRTPGVIPRNVFDERYISGGSSSGSAVAVAAGLAAFALGTDTAGSGRVPAAFNEIVGLKPTRGLLSTSGVVPACRSLDCVSVFAASVAEAEEVLQIAGGFDQAEPFSRKAQPSPAQAGRRLGIPAPSELDFFGDAESAGLYEEAIARFKDLGFSITEIDFAPFRAAAKLLYAGPWVAERLAAIRPFFEKQQEEIHPVVRELIAGAARYSAVDAFQASYELARLRRLADAEWDRMDALLLPTAPTIYTVAELLENPIALNSHLGTYTNFVNLLDLCGIAIPAGRKPTTGLPFGVTLLAPAFADSFVCGIARSFLAEPSAAASATAGEIQLAVVGAHLSGQPLNSQLTERGARLVATSRTAPDYQLFALANTSPAKPGLVHAPGFAGPGIEIEIWALTPAAFGDFVAHVPPPMVIGTAKLENGTSCKSFLCEPFALEGACEITQFGGWRAYLASLPLAS